jgi:hypothetical protein
LQYQSLSFINTGENTTQIDIADAAGITGVSTETDTIIEKLSY